MGKNEGDRIVDPQNTVGSPHDPDNIVRHGKLRLGSVDVNAWSDRLARFIAAQPGISGDVKITNIHQPSNGGSSGTLMFSAMFNQGSDHLQKDFVLRYTTQGGLFRSYNLPGQYSILQTLYERGIAVPGVIGIDTNGETLGVTGFVMERVTGDVPPSSYHRSGLFFNTPLEDRKHLIFEGIANLAKLHAVNWRGSEIEFLLERGNGTSALERDLDWHFSSLRWGCPDEVRDLEPILQWLIANQPLEENVSLNHGDAMLGNYMFENGRVVAILDWELAFLGHPANDIAYQVLSHYCLGFGGELLAGFPSEQEWKEEYERVSGIKLTNWDYFCAVTAFKLHISFLLVYRDVTLDMETARRSMRAFTLQSLTKRLEKCNYGGSDLSLQ